MSSWRELSSSRRARWPAVRGAVGRPRLLPGLSSAQVLVVVAAAGYGKTTALASGVPALGGRQAWLTLDADDADPQVLVAGLALAVEGLPGGAAVGALLDAGAAPRRVAAKVADVLDASAAFLVLDEAQHLSGPLTGDVLREVLDCGSGRVALLSRLPLPLLELAPLEAAGEVTRLSAADLSFTPEEIADLLRAQGLSPAGSEVRLAHALTEGWPIAVRFLAQAVAQGRVRLSELADLDGGEAQLGTLFAYLAGEVLGPLMPALRDLLTRSSVFEELTPELLQDVLHEENAGALLEALAGSGTFLTRVGDAAYRAHPLLRAHLRASLPPEEVRGLSARGAAYFERTGRYRRALAAFLLAGNAGRAAELLAQRGAEWLAQGRVNLVERSLHRLPHEAWTPQLHALAGDALRLSSRYAEALAEYAQADALARALGQVQVALDTVQPDLAWEALQTAESLATIDEEQARVRRLRAENLLNAGRLAEALALEPELAVGARYALRSGDLQRALAIALQAAAGEMGGARAAQNHREGLLLTSFLQAILGDPAASAQAAREGLREGERLESPFVRSLALARLGHAQHTAGQGAAARASYEQALALAQGVANRLRVEPLMGLTYLTASRGELTRTAELKAEALAQTGGDGYMTGLVHLTAALGHLHAGQHDSDGLEAAQQAFTACGDAFGLACVALARFAGAGGDAPEAAQAAARYPFLLSRRAMLSPFPSRAQRAKLLAQLAALHPDAAPQLEAAARELGYAEVPTPEETPGFEVQVQVLGRVQVTRSHEGGKAREWGRAKARDLLALLAVHEGGLPREAAQEALFPDAEPGVGERNFRVTLHALGQVLEEGAASGVVLERGEWLRLRDSPDLHVDLWLARELLNAPVGTAGRLGALLHLPAAVATSDLSDVQREAERYAVLLPEALSAEAAHALNTGQPEAAARAAERALTLDPAHEPAARALMRAHHARGNVAAVWRVYANLTDALLELNLTPTAETEALSRALGG